MSPLFCVCPVRLNRGIRNVRAKNLKKYIKNAHSPIIDGRFSDQPNREHGNPLKLSIYLKVSPLFYACVTLI